MIRTAMLSPTTFAKSATAHTSEFYDTPPHILYTDECILRGIKGDPDYRRIAIQMPPRHGKSELACKYVPAWFVGMHPDKRVILTAYGTRFANDWGRKARDLLAEFGPDFFNVGVRGDSHAVDSWATTKPHTGGMWTAGIGGGITGRGADLLICDDPIKDFEEALSLTMREKVWDWWKSTAYTRLEPGGMAVVIMTRWHEDDLIGRLTSPEWNPNYQDWKVISFPAIAEEQDILGREPGDALWPERFPIAELEEKRMGDPNLFEALYQQNPDAMSKGTTFQRDWFQVVDHDSIPPEVWVAKSVRYWDKAIGSDLASKRQQIGKAHTVGALVALHDSVIYILDVVRFRAHVGATQERIKATAEHDGYNIPIAIEQEGGSSGVEAIEYYRKMLFGWRFDGDKPTGPKEARAALWAGHAEARRVVLVRAAWNGAFLSECEAFPNGNTLDQVDAVSGAVKMLSVIDAGVAVDRDGEDYREDRYDPRQSIRERSLLRGRS